MRRRRKGHFIEHAWCPIFYPSYPILHMLKWSSQQINYESVDGSGFIPSLTAHGLDNEGLDTPLPDENTSRLRGRYYHLRRTLTENCIICFFSPAPRACSLILLGSLSVSQHVHSSSALAHKAKQSFPQPTAGTKTFSLERYRQRGSCRGLGQRQGGESEGEDPDEA